MLHPQADQDQIAQVQVSQRRYHQKTRDDREEVSVQCQTLSNFSKLDILRTRDAQRHCCGVVTGEGCEQEGSCS